jgi:hypothetical protein
MFILKKKLTRNSLKRSFTKPLRILTPVFSVSGFHSMSYVLVFTSLGVFLGINHTDDDNDEDGDM